MHTAGRRDGPYVKYDEMWYCEVVTTALVPCDTRVNIWLLKRCRPLANGCRVILSRIDYCNSLLYGTPVAVVDKLQRAQNDVVCVICQHRSCVHARPLLHSLHWVPVQQRIQYKIAVTTTKVLSTSIPPYNDELLQRLWRRGLCGPLTLSVSLSTSKRCCKIAFLAWTNLCETPHGHGWTNEAVLEWSCHVLAT